MEAGAGTVVAESGVGVRKATLPAHGAGGAVSGGGRSFADNFKGSQNTGATNMHDYRTMNTAPAIPFFLCGNHTWKNLIAARHPLTSDRWPFNVNSRQGVNSSKRQSTSDTLNIVRGGGRSITQKISLSPATCCHERSNACGLHHSHTEVPLVPRSIIQTSRRCSSAVSPRRLRSHDRDQRGMPSASACEKT